MRNTRALGLIASVLLAGCDVDTLLNQTAIFGPTGATAPAGAPLNSGLRDTFRVFIENNTQFRAIFTTGVFDNTDERTNPVFFQFSTESMLTPNNSQLANTLEGNTDTGIMVLPCGRVFSIGSPSLINLIERNRAGALDERIADAALLDGVGFASVGANSADADTPREGFASPFEALLGVDFNCGSLLVFSLDFAEFGPDRFKINLIDVFPAGRPEDN